uniref:Uncharacterized protein n=1 Tax=Cyprinus carpio TaxID=7962 RepID=A0A8C2JRK2_CYPCA
YRFRMQITSLQSTVKLTYSRSHRKYDCTLRNCLPMHTRLQIPHPAIMQCWLFC